mgnify:CR=1 FL=1
MIKLIMQADTGLDTLLDLDGYTIDQEGGYWIKVEARRVPIFRTASVIR